MESHYTLLLLFSLLISPLSTLADIPSGCPDKERDILLQVKAHFKGVGPLSEWVATDDCCSWPLIECYGEDDPLEFFGRVGSLYIDRGHGFVGEIPDVIGNLPYLINLVIDEEPNITGPIPQSISKLTYLQRIRLTSNSLSGPIPSFLGNLKKLVQIQLSDNKFSGSIPTSLSNLPALYDFDVSRNMLTGSIPSLSRKLKTFDVSNNKLCGLIPKGLQRFNSSAFDHNKCLCGHPLPACN